MMKTILLFMMFLFGTNLISASTINVTPATIGTSLTSAVDGDILLLGAGTYSAGINFQNGKVITLQGVDKATVIITQLITLGGTAVTDCGLIFKDLTIDINNSNYFIDGSIGNVKTLELQNVVVQKVNRCFLRTGTQGYTIDLIKLNNCTIKNCGVGYYFFGPVHKVKNVEVTNSTLYNYGGDNFFYARNTATTDSFNFSFQNNTVYKWGLATKALCNVGALYGTSSNYVFKNNIIAEQYTTTNIVTATGGNLVAQKNLVVNYGSYSITSPTSSSITDNTLAGLGLSTVGFTDPANGDFSILSTSPIATASTTGGIIGDPRWLKVASAPANLTISASPAAGGTVTPTSATYNQGDNVTVTATRNFGYAFSRWTDGNGNTVSTANPYVFTINANTTLVAEFVTIPTYTLTLNTSGAYGLGDYTISPAGKDGGFSIYENGTNVTITAVENDVIKFSKWDDNSTALSKVVTMNANTTVTGYYTNLPFIAGWTFKNVITNQYDNPRVAELYSYVNNRPQLRAYRILDNSVAPDIRLINRAGTNGVSVWNTDRGQFFYFMTSFSTVGHKNIAISSGLIGYYYGCDQWTFQYSLDGVNFVDVSSLTTINSSTITSIGGVLPADAEDKAIVYLRWFPNVNGPKHGSSTDVTATNLSNVMVKADENSTTWDGTVWSNGTPSTSLTAIIAGTYNTNPNGAFTAKKLTVNSGSLTVNSNTNLTIQNEVINNAGTNGIVVENNANLIQINNTPNNTGNVVVKRNSNALYRLDYTMWSSPVAGQKLADFSPLTSQSPSRFYTYDAVNNVYASVASPTTTTFTAGTGYLIRMPNTTSASTPETFTGIFTGVPNNGNVSLTGLTSNAYYAVGNPYTSTISADAFINGNSTAGTLYFWRKKNNAANTSYATYTLAGGAGTGANTGDPNNMTPNGTIQVGQGFIVKTGVAATTLNFTNAMRETTPTSTQFLKIKPAAEKSRLWLNLSSKDGGINQMMIAYMEGATADVDNSIDGKYINDAPTALTSKINNEEYVIQGRPAFDASDVVALNFKTDKTAEYKIAIDHTDGLFAKGQNIYLVDSVTGTETNLTKESYIFTAESGTNNDRFTLKYQSSFKTVGSPVFDENTVTVYKTNGTLYVNSAGRVIVNIKVFDIQGRLIAEQKEVNAANTVIKNLKATQQVLLIQVTSDDKKVVTKKVVN